MKLLNKKNLVVAFGLSFLAFGCGQAPQPLAPVVAPVTSTPTNTVTQNQSCPAGEVAIGPMPCSTTAQLSCQYGGGIWKTLASNGTQVCEYTFGITPSQYPSGYSLFASQGSFPYLTGALGSGAGNTGIQVVAGDILNYQGTGGYGNSSTESTNSNVLFWGLIKFNSQSQNCSAIDLTGSNSGTAVQYNGTPAALYGSDGTDYFELGTHLSNYKILNPGQLTIGFNAPPDAYNCTDLVIQELAITRCQDVSGNVYNPCQ